MSDAGPIIVKRKKVMPAAHHGGSWKVAYADFVTAMMAFFMVLWIMGMDAETRSMVAGYFNDPMGFVKNPPKSKTPFVTAGSAAPKPGVSGPRQKDNLSNSDTTGGGKKDDEELRKLKSEIESAAQKGDDAALKVLLKHTEVLMTEEGLRIEMVETAGAAFFESGKAVILPGAKQLIQKIVAPTIKHSGRKVMIEGHTDAQPYGGSAYTNWDLSSDRALAMYHELVADGVKDGQFVQVRGFAATKLKNKQDPYDFSNRRVSILIPYKSIVEPMSDLPADVFKDKIQGAFRKDVAVAPDRPNIKGDGKNPKGPPAIKF